MDKDWFDQQLARRGKSMRGLANHLGIDVAGVSRMFSGQRKMKPGEVTPIARYLEVPPEEVVKRAGAPELMKGVRSYEVEGEVQADGKVTDLKKPRPLPASVVAQAEAMTGGQMGEIRIAQVRADKGALTLLDDAVLVYERTDYVEPDAVGTLSMMRLRDGVQMLGRLKSVRKTGEAVVEIDGKDKTLEIVSASKVRVIT
jgi:DNA-binding transcriptional regulator YdaS (Cro superfamily)